MRSRVEVVALRVPKTRASTISKKDARTEKCSKESSEIPSILIPSCSVA